MYVCDMFACVSECMSYLYVYLYICVHISVCIVYIGVMSIYVHMCTEYV